MKRTLEDTDSNKGQSSVGIIYSRVYPQTSFSYNNASMKHSLEDIDSNEGQSSYIFQGIPDEYFPYFRPKRAALISYMIF